MIGDLTAPGEVHEGIWTRPGQPFSNGTEWEAWSGAWCWFCSAAGDCKIIDEAMLNPTRTPIAWEEGNPRALGRDRYTCREFEPVGSYE